MWWPWRSRRDPRPVAEVEDGLRAVTDRLEQSTLALMAHLIRVKEDEGYDQPRP